MLPFKNILNPTDFSEPSYKAIKFAGEIASHFKSRLIVLHVVSLTPILQTPDVPVSFDIDSFQKVLEAEARQRLAKVTEQLVPKEVGLITRITTGYYPDEILRIAREEQSDLIVMGTRGRTGLPHLLLGSVAERVVQLAPCPVLTIGRTIPIELPANFMASALSIPSPGKKR